MDKRLIEIIDRAYKELKEIESQDILTDAFFDVSQNFIDTKRYGWRIADQLKESNA